MTNEKTSLDKQLQRIQGNSMLGRLLGSGRLERVLPCFARAWD